MNRNIELKARLLDFQAALRTAEAIGAVAEVGERQLDTYFNVTTGRLKLRERWKLPDSAERAADPANYGESLPSQLIWYHRSDESQPRPSDYSLAVVPSGIRDMLAGAIGIKAEIEKRRRIFLHDNVRIHLDLVTGLGSFLEFEAIVDRSGNDALALDKLLRLSELFNITPGQVLSGSYSDMLGRL